MNPRDDLPAEFEEMLRFGTVKSVDHASGRVVVAVGELETDGIRWLERRAGGTRTWSPPSVGEQVLLLAPSGEIAGAVALGGIAQDAHPLPGNSARELIAFADGAVLAYDPEAHQLEAALPEGATIVLKATGGVSIDATAGGLTIKGDVRLEGKLEATGDVVAGQISLQKHVHPGVEPGAGTTEPPI